MRTYRKKAEKAATQESETMLSMTSTLTPASDAEKNPAIRDKTGRFVKGVSGNPTGRPERDPEIRALCVIEAPANVDALKKLRDSSKDPWLRLEAIRVMLQYAFGKPALIGGTQPLLINNISLSASMSRGDALRTLTQHPELPQEDQEALVAYIRGPDPTPALPQRAAERQVIDAGPVHAEPAAAIASPAAPSAAVAEPTPPMPAPPSPAEDPRIQPLAPDVSVWEQLGGAPAVRAAVAPAADGPPPPVDYEPLTRDDVRAFWAAAGK
jgi:hypothetical protein